MTTFDHGYALLIGVDQNAVSEWALPDVGKDITALREVLIHPERCGYSAQNVTVLTGKEATRQGILNGLEWLAARLQADADATGMIYYTGHGWRDTSKTPAEFYFIPYDVKNPGIQTRALRAPDFAAEIADMQPQRLLVILDCCHASGMGIKEVARLPEGYVNAPPPPTLFMQGEAGGIVPGAKGLESLAQGRGRAVLSASTGEQRSYIRKDRRMSIFTYHLIEALTGHAQPQAGATEVLVSDVMSYVHRQVPRSARADWDREQTPDYQVSGNFPVALLLGGKGLAQGGAAPAPETLGTPAIELSGQFSGPVAVGGGEAVDFRGSQGANYKPAGPVTQHFGEQIHAGRDVTTASGPRSVAVGADVHGSTIITGDVGHLIIQQPASSNQYPASPPFDGAGDERIAAAPPASVALISRLHQGLQRLDAVEIETLCLLHAPEIQDKFGRRQRRDEMINTILEHCRLKPENAVELVKHLK